MTAGFEQAWRDLDLPVRCALEQSYAALRAGGLGCGAVLTNAVGTVIAEGRNRAYDAPGGDDILQGSPIAHAEMNVLAAIETDCDLEPCTLWTTQEPCSMCASAVAFTGVGTVRYVAPDPWAIATDQSRLTSDAVATDPAGLHIIGPLAEDSWVVAANLIFLLSIGRTRGADHPTIVRNTEVEPETSRVALHLVASAESALPAVIEEFLRTSWPEIAVAAGDRARRVAASRVR